jgi:long-chain fatty acid transport protein
MNATKSVFSVLAVGWAGSAWAAGFAVDTHAGRATGMASAVTSFIDDASAAYYNPAGLAQGKGLDVQVGDTVIVPSFKFQNPGGISTQGKFNAVPPPHLYAAYGITDDFSLGFGLFSPYGLVVPWPDNWEGQFLSVRSDLKTFYMNPEVAYRFADRVSVGAGVQIVRATVTLNRNLNFVDSIGKVDLGGAAWGVGANIGVQVQILPKILSFGASWRSAVGLRIKGRAHFSSVPLGLQTLLADQVAATEVHLPNTLVMGLGYRPIPALQLGFDVGYTGWQLVRNLAIKFANPDLTTIQAKNWTHTWNFHLGGEYTINPQWRVRAGLKIDPTPSPQDTITPELPDSNRVDIALGAGYRWRNFTFDLGYQLVVITSVTSTAPQFPGMYSGVANLASLTIGFHL